ncbi:hypothetical protein FRC07_010333, partial [Ceratobasidium sp. 392]
MSRIGPVEPLHIHIDVPSRFRKPKNMWDTPPGIIDALKLIKTKGSARGTDRWKSFYLKVPSDLRPDVEIPQTILSGT